MINLYFLIPPFIAQIFNPIAEPIILIGIPTKGEQPEKETHPVILEAKIRKC